MKLNKIIELLLTIYYLNIYYKYSLNYYFIDFLIKY